MAVYFLCRKVMNKSSSKYDLKPLYYATITPPCYTPSQYGKMQYHNAVTISPQKSTSNYSLSHYEVMHLQHQNSRIV